MLSQVNHSRGNLHLSSFGREAPDIAPSFTHAAETPRYGSVDDEGELITIAGTASLSARSRRQLAAPPEQRHLHRDVIHSGKIRR